METHSYKVYKFNELTEEQQQLAIENYRGDRSDYVWHKDNVDSLEAFCDVFNVEMPDFEYGCRDYIHSAAFNPDYEEVMSFTGIRLYKYIMNNYYDSIMTPKYIKFINHHVKHKRCRNKIAKHTKNEYSIYYSAISRVSCCPFTGYCTDDVLLDPVFAFLKNPDKTTTMEDILNDCFNAWLKCCSEDYEYQNSDEAIKETILANDYDFTVDGEID